MSNFNNTTAPVAGATGYDDPAGTHGPHHSRVGNALDPRVDSDRDGRAATNVSVPSTGYENQTPRYENQPIGNRGVTGYDDPAGTHGPHASRVGNAADPRVDSDRDGRAAPNASVPAAGYAGQAGGYTHGTTAGTTHGTTGITHGGTTAGTTHGTTTGVPVGAATGTHNTHTTVDDGHRKKGGVVEGIKGVFAQCHGMGESVRGHFNAGVDGLLGDKEGQRKDAAVAAGGEREFANKEFEHRGTLDKSLGPGPNH
ncbi:hypothetical protein ACHAQA_003566 [Verticillium albo-atrum]